MDTFDASPAPCRHRHRHRYFHRHRLRAAWMSLIACAALAACADPPVSATSHADASPAAVGPEVEIPFVRQSGVRDWRALDDRRVLVQGDQGRWYLVTLQAPSIDLAYAEGIGFETLPSGALARLGALVIKGARHPIVSIVEAKPPGKTPRP